MLLQSKIIRKDTKKSIVISNTSNELLVNIASGEITQTKINLLKAFYGNYEIVDEIKKTNVIFIIIDCK